MDVGFLLGTDQFCLLGPQLLSFCQFWRSQYHCRPYRISPQIVPDTAGRRSPCKAFEGQKGKNGETKITAKDGFCMQKYPGIEKVVRVSARGV